MSDRDRAGRRLLAVSEEELQRIVLDIHDGPVQNLFAALGQLTLLKNQLAEIQGTDHSVGTINRVMELLEASLRDIRDLLGTFRAPEFTQLTIPQLAEELAVQHETLSSATVTLEIAEPLAELSLTAKIALYRILQEALSNIRRHAGVNDAIVRAWSTRRKLVLEVVDNGRGFEPPPLVGRNATERHEHIGLRGMRERAELIGGMLEVESELGSGTCVRVEIPIHDRDQAYPHRTRR